jgi:hypothetical protein
VEDRYGDPTDHARTTQQRVGEGMRDTRGLPGYLLIGLGVLALVVCLAAAAYGYMGWTIAMGVVAVLAASAGSVWVFAERRRVARIAATDEQGRPAANP